MEGGEDYVIPVAGVPGTGKTTLSILLSEILGCRHLDSSSLLRMLGLVERDPTGRKTQLVRGGGLIRAVEAIPSGKCILLETLYPLEWLWAGLEERVPVIILLRTHPLTLYKRLSSSRPNWPRDKIIENVLAEAHNVLAEDLLEVQHFVIEVDTTSLPPEATATALLDMLEAWSTGIRIDWLSRDPDIIEAIARWGMELDLDKYRFGY